MGKIKEIIGTILRLLFKPIQWGEPGNRKEFAGGVPIIVFIGIALLIFWAATC